MSRTLGNDMTIYNRGYRPKRWQHPFQAAVHIEYKLPLPPTIDSGHKFANFFREFDPTAIICGSSLPDGGGNRSRRTKMLRAWICFSELKVLETFVELWHGKELDGIVIQVKKECIPNLPPLGRVKTGAEKLAAEKAILASRPPEVRSSRIREESKMLVNRAERLKKRTEDALREEKEDEMEHALNGLSSLRINSVLQRNTPRLALRSRRLLSKEEGGMTVKNHFRMPADSSSEGESSSSSSSSDESDEDSSDESMDGSDENGDDEDNSDE